MKSIWTALLSVLTSSLMAYGQASWTNPVVISNGLSGKASHDTAPRIARDPSGGLAVTWVGQTRSGTTTITESRHSDIYISFSSDSGSTWTPSLRLSNPAYYNGEVDIAPGDPNQFHCVWNSGDTFSNNRLHMIRMLNGSVGYSYERIDPFVADDGVGFFSPRILTVGANLILAKSSRNFTPENPAYDGYLYSRSRYLTAGVDWIETNRIVPPPPRPPYLPYHSVLPGMPASHQQYVAVPFAVMYRKDESPIYHSIWVSTSSDSGNTWTTTGTVSPETIPAAYPAISTDGNGTWILLWLNKHGPLVVPEVAGDQFHFQKSTDNGISWSAPQLATVQNGLVDNLSEASLATDGAGHWLAVFQGENSTGAGYGKDGEIFYTLSGDGGESWTPVDTIIPSPETDTAVDAMPRALYLKENKWAVVWSRAQDESGANIVIATSSFPIAPVADWPLY